MASDTHVFSDLLSEIPDDTTSLLMLNGRGVAVTQTAGARGRPAEETRIWSPGDVGWVANIIEHAWSRWLLFYPQDWRTVGQAIPYVHLRATFECDEPRTYSEAKVEEYEHDELTQRWLEAYDTWERNGKAGPEPDRPEPFAYGHAHSHDHGICIDPWLADHTTAQVSLEKVLMHELAHAIAGTFGHEEEWVSMCGIIGYDPGPEREADWQGSPAQGTERIEPAETARDDQLVLWPVP